MFKKVKSYSIKEFMNKEVVQPLSEEEKKTAFETGVLGGVLIPLAVGPFLQVKAAFANEAIPVTTGASITTGAIYDKMLHAFDPLITLIQAIAYPVAMVVVLGGALFIMIGNKEKGFTMMQGAGLGYVLVQLTPLFLKILVEAMKSV